jgi:phosphoglycolate phosphatase-like HAD superfamily hydrolase
VPLEWAAWIYRKVYNTGMCWDNKLLSLAIVRKLIIYIRVRIWQWIAEDQEAIIFPGVEDFLKKLRESGVRIFASSLARHARGRLQKSGLDKYFDLMIGVDDSRNKHDHLDLFANLVGVSRQEFCAHAFSVGDSLADMDVAHKNRVYAVGVSTRYLSAQLWFKGAHFTVRGVSDLIFQTTEVKQ